MRILIAADTYYPNVDGASYFSQRLASELKKRGHAVLVIAPSTGRYNEHVVHDNVDIFGVYSLPTLFHKDFRFSPPFVIVPQIRKAILDFKPDVIHIQGHFFVERAVAHIAKKLGVPVLGTNHFMPENLTHYVHAPAWIERRIIRIAWLQFLAVFKRLPVVTTPTKIAAAKLKTVGLARPAVVLSCGIDLERFNPARANEALRARYHLPTAPLLLCVGRLAPEKNIDCILRAVAEALKKTQLYLVVAGGGLERANLEKLAAELGITKAISFVGFVPDVDLPGLYPLASAFVVAGTIELQSLVTMEAMASGLPILAADALALPELVHEGKNGYLFKANDHHMLAQKIELIFSDPALRERLAQKSLEFVQAHNIKNTIGEFEKLYVNLINRPK